MAAQEMAQDGVSGAEPEAVSMAWLLVAAER